MSANSHANPLQVAALHRYWMWANQLRELFEQELIKPEWITNHKELTDKHPEIIGVLFISSTPGMLMSHWYGALYVAVEGWRELGLTDPIIDPLINDPAIDLLKRYRNGAFHYQKNYFDDRFAAFMAEQTSVTWIRKLNLEMGRFFLQYVNANTEPAGSANSPSARG